MLITGLMLHDIYLRYTHSDDAVLIISDTLRPHVALVSLPEAVSHFSQSSLGSEIEAAICTAFVK